MISSPVAQHILYWGMPLFTIGSTIGKETARIQGHANASSLDLQCSRLNVPRAAHGVKVSVL